MDEWQISFAETIAQATKCVVSSTLSGVDWDAELVRGEGLWVGGVTLPLALADRG